LILLAFVWGLFKNTSGWFALPLLFYPAAWPVLLTGYGYRRGLIGRADFTGGSVAGMSFPFARCAYCPAWLGGLGRVWVRRQEGPIPVLPGLLIGLVIYLLLWPFPS